MGSDKLKEGEPVWARHRDQAWVRGKVSRVSKSGLVTVVSEKGATLEVGPGDVEYCSTTPAQERQVDDLTKLPDLHHPALLAALHERFKIDKVYSYSSAILIALNPFKQLAIYEPSRMLEYLQAGPGGQAALPPHAYNIAHNAYSAMINNDGQNQSILVSGESGAGKTVSTKVVLSYLTVVSSGNHKEALSEYQAIKEHRKASKSSVSTAVLEANPLMESFGNARTLRNDNSSRFGKLIQMQFGPRSGRLEGASIDVYLLEKSRVVHQVDGERNYHIFYEMEKGLSSSERSNLLWPDVKQSRYTSRSTCFKRDDVADEKQFKDTQKALDAVGFSASEQQTCFALVSAVLNLGNVDFEDCDVGGAEGSRVSSKGGSRQALQQCAALLQVDVKTLEAVLTSRAINMSAQSISKPLTPAEAVLARDGLAQTLYERMFLWIVWRINERTSSQDGKDRRRSSPKGALATPTAGGQGQEYFYDYSIGCLDIFGFEVFEQNSLEQLLINWTNEQLQGQFNEFVFRLEQKVYESEGIDWTVIDFPDNTKCLELISSRGNSVLTLLNSECLMPSGTDQGLLGKIYGLARSYPEHLLAEPTHKSRMQFGVRHFAGSVAYDVRSFCYKNKNELRPEAVTLVRGSKVPVISILLPEEAAARGFGSDPMEYFSRCNQESSQSGGGKYRSSLQRAQKLTRAQSGKLQSETVSSNFKTQLTVLMSYIGCSAPHYIRCIKSNDRNIPDEFNRLRVEEQLCYSGVLEAVKVTRAGYSSRFPMKEFAMRYAAVAAGGKEAARAARRLKGSDRSALLDACERILSASKLRKMDDFQVGRTKIFLKPHAYSNLEIQRADALRRQVVVIQRAVRAWLKWLKAERAKGGREREKRLAEEMKKQEALKKQQEKERLREKLAEMERQKKKSKRREPEEEPQVRPSRAKNVSQDGNQLLFVGLPLGLATYLLLNPTVFFGLGAVAAALLFGASLALDATEDNGATAKMTGPEKVKFALEKMMESYRKSQENGKRRHGGKRAQRRPKADTLDSEMGSSIVGSVMTEDSFDDFDGDLEGDQDLDFDDEVDWEPAPPPSRSRTNRSDPDRISSIMQRKNPSRTARGMSDLDEGEFVPVPVEGKRRGLVQRASSGVTKPIRSLPLLARKSKKS